jgi:site-specific recombinase XerD
MYLRFWRHPLARSRREPDAMAAYLATLAAGRSRAECAWRLKRLAFCLTHGALDACHCAWHRVTYAQAIALRATLAERLAYRTVNAQLATLRAVWRQCWTLGLLDAEQLMRLQRVPRVRGASLPAGRALTHDELARCVRACQADRTARGHRAGAVLALLYGTGMRRAELCALALGDYAAGGVLRVHGKGNRERLAYLGDPGLQRLVEAWLQLRGPEPGALICQVAQHSQDVHPRSGLDGDRVGVVVRRIATAAGVAPFTPHDLRRTTATHLLDAGEDLEVVARVLGHQRIETTALYVRRGEDSKRRAAARLVVPLIT